MEWELGCVWEWDGNWAVFGNGTGTGLCLGMGREPVCVCPGVITVLPLCDGSVPADQHSQGFRFEMKKC